MYNTSYKIFHFFQNIACDIKIKLCICIVNDIAKRLLLETNTVTPLLKRMEAEGIVTRCKGKEDARQMIVKLTSKGRDLQKKLTNVPETVGNAVICESVSPETVPSLFEMLDDIIKQLKQ